MNNAIYDKSNLTPLSKVKVTSVNGVILQDVEWDSIDIFEMTGFIPIADNFGNYPTLSNSLVDKKLGCTVNLLMIHTKNKINSKYGKIDSIVLPKNIVSDFPSIQFIPLTLEYLDYIPFIEDGKKFIMLRVIEYGVPPDATMNKHEEKRTLTHRYVYRYDNDNLNYVDSYHKAIEELVNNSMNNFAKTN